MAKRTVLALSFTVGLALTAVGFALSAGWQVREAERRAEETQVRALTDAVGHLEAMAADLALAVSADAPLPVLIGLRHDADLAAAALAQVGFEGQGGEALRRFAACTAEFGGVMADELARGVRRVPDYGVLTHLRDFALPLVETVLPDAVDPATGRIDDRALLRHFSGMGRLYYDGIGSDVVPPGGYLSLMRGTPIGEDAARRIAADAVGGEVHLRSVTAEGEPARYCFSANNLTVAVSAQDGRLLTLLYDRRARAGDVGLSVARAAAEAAAAAYVPDSLGEIGHTMGEGCYYFTFAPTRDGVLCLSERVLIGIDAATGRLSLWDADRYYRYATVGRNLPAEMLTPEEAALSCGGAASVTFCTALRADGRELLCYRLGEGESAVYVNAVNGRIEMVS